VKHPPLVFVFAFVAIATAPAMTNHLQLRRPVFVDDRSLRAGPANVQRLMSSASMFGSPGAGGTGPRAWRNAMRWRWPRRSALNIIRSERPEHHENRTRALTSDINTS
jgi:hypothetical protein